MFLGKLLNIHKKKYWLVFHALLGISSTVSPWPLIFWFYYVFFKSLSAVLSGHNFSRNLAISYLIAYLVPFELLARMAQTSPYVPYELSKYLMFILLGYGIIRNNVKRKVGFWLFILLLPALFFDLSSQVIFSDIVFNLLGPVNLTLAILYFSNIGLVFPHLKNTLGLMLYPLFCVLVFTFIKTPAYNEIEFNLGANFSTTGGFGSNQVSTALGLGAFLTFLFWLNRWKWSGLRKLDAFLLFGFLFQGLLTFSRGGMLGGALGIIIVGWYVSNLSLKDRIKYRLPNFKKYVLPATFIIIITITLGNQITDGKLLLRYQGETQSTLKGTRDKTLNLYTTNRFDILLGDIELLLEFPITGVGAGASKYLRPTHNGNLAHVEFSRLLAEHGSLGLIFILIFLGLSYNILKIKISPLCKSILISLFLIGIFTSFHAAMRTFVTPLLVGLSQINIRREL